MNLTSALHMRWHKKDVNDQIWLHTYIVHYPVPNSLYEKRERQKKQTQSFETTSL